MARIQCPECGSPADDQDLACANCELILNPRAPGGRYVVSQPSIVRALLSPPDWTGVREIPKPPPGHKVHEQVTVLRAVSLTGEEVPRLMVGLDAALHPLHPFEAYVVSFCDGSTTVKEVATVAQLRMVEVNAVMSSLIERRVLQLDRDGKRNRPAAGASSEPPETEPARGPEEAVPLLEGASAAPILPEEPTTDVTGEPEATSAPVAAPAPRAAPPPTRPPPPQRPPPPPVVAAPPPRLSPPAAPAPRPPPVVTPARGSPAPRAPAPGGNRPPPTQAPRSPPTSIPGGSQFNVSRSGLRVLPLEQAVRPRDETQNVLEHAVSLEKKGEVRGAIEILKRGIAKVAKPAPLYNKLALILLDQRRDYAQAEELIQKALELDPSNSVYQQNLYRVVGLAASAVVPDSGPERGSSYDVDDDPPSSSGRKKDPGFLSKLWKK